METKQEKFYIYIKRTNGKECNRFVERVGTRWAYNGITLYIYRDDAGQYICTEPRCGGEVEWGRTIAECMADAAKAIDDVGERFEEIVEKNIAKYGLSPLYAEGLK